MASQTPNYDFNLPEVDGSEDLWGELLNQNWTELDTLLEARDGTVAGLDGRLTTAEGDITGLDGRLTTAEGDITGLDSRLTTAEGLVDDVVFVQDSILTPELRQWLNVLGSEGVAGPAWEQIQNMDKLVSRLKLIGVWEKLDALYLLNSSPGDAIFYNLVNASSDNRLTPQGTEIGHIPYFGWQGNRTDNFLRTGITLGDSKMKEDSFHGLVYIPANTVSSLYDLGTDDSFAFYIISRSNAGNIVVRAASSQHTVPAPNGTSEGVTLVSRVGSIGSIYRDSEKADEWEIINSTSLDGLQINILRASSARVGYRTQGVVAFGSGLTDKEATLYSKAISDYVEGINDVI